MTHSYLVLLLNTGLPKVLRKKPSNYPKVNFRLCLTVKTVSLESIGLLMTSFGVNVRRPNSVQFQSSWTQMTACSGLISMAQIGLKVLVCTVSFPVTFRSGPTPTITAKFSPDAYIQMALQLAWYRTRREFTATYETVLTRVFRHGRTETLRTFTNESRAWVLAMDIDQWWLEVCVVISSYYPSPVSFFNRLGMY